MSLAIKNDRPYSYGDYLTWNADERWELIDGIAYAMGPASSSKHQEIFGIIFNALFNYLQDKKCRVYSSPLDVRFPEKNTKKDDQIFTVLQPDILVVCDPAKIDDRGCVGPPDLIVEILSPSSSHRDTRQKFQVYEKHGVIEYWIVYPAERILEIFNLDNEGKYREFATYRFDDAIKGRLFSDLKVDLSSIE